MTNLELLDVQFCPMGYSLANILLCNLLGSLVFIFIALVVIKPVILKVPQFNQDKLGLGVFKVNFWLTTIKTIIT
jgi:hypothetical protein